MRIVQISDSHIGVGLEIPSQNLERVVDYINDTLQPDLVIHTGDVVALSPDEPGDREHARAALARLAAPLLILPGNHDIGEGGDRPWMGFTITSTRVAAHRAAFGPDRFSHAAGDWLLVGVNSELFGSGLPEEAEQWEWLTFVLADPRPAHVALFQHQPLWWPDGRTGSDAVLSVPDPEATRLLALPGAERIRVVASGHLHRYYHEGRGGIAEVWAPSTAFISAVYGPELSGLGIVEWKLSGERLTPELHVPDGLDMREARDMPGVRGRLAELQAPAASGGQAA